MQNEVEYIFFLLSNSAFFIPAFYVWTSNRFKNEWNFQDTFLHGLFCMLTGVVSLMYHVCDTGNCFLSFDIMFSMDYLMSLMVVFNLLSYGIPKQFRFLRDTIVILAFVGLAYLAVLYQSTRDDNTFWLFGFVGAVIVLLVRLVIRAFRHDSRWLMWPLRQKHHVLIWFPTEGNLYFAIACVVTWVGAFLCFYFDGGEPAPAYYEEIHGLWHFLAAMGQLTAFMFFDSLHEPIKYETVPLMVSV